MDLFDDILHDVGETVAAVAPHPPPVLHAAVQTAARALLGQPEARQKLQTLGSRSPELRDLFGQVHQALMRHPGFLHTLSAAELHRAPVHPSHPRARQIRQGVMQTMHAAEAALPGLLQSIGQAQRTAARATAPRPPHALPGGFPSSFLLPGSIAVAGYGPCGPSPSEMLPGDAYAAGYRDEDGYDVGRVHPAHAHGGAHTHYVHPAPAGTRHGPGWRRHQAPHPAHARGGVIWGGPSGWGADYLLDERTELEEEPTPDDGEPEWRRRHGRRWMGD